MKSFKKKGHINTRRKGVVARLKEQLKDGVKPGTETTKDFAGVERTKIVPVPLTDKDKERIRTEIRTLESRL